GRRLPALGPAIDVGSNDGGAVDDVEGAQVFLNLVSHAEIALDKDDRTGAAAESFQTDGSSAGEEIEKRSVGDCVAENAEERLPNHLRRRPNLRIHVASQLSAAQAAGDNPQLRSHEKSWSFGSLTSPKREQGQPLLGAAG